MIINQLAEHLVPAGGVYSSSVTSQASRAATELVPIAALVMASPIVNCSSICLACNERNKSHESETELPQHIHFTERLLNILFLSTLCCDSAELLLANGVV